MLPSLVHLPIVGSSWCTQTRWFQGTPWATLRPERYTGSVLCFSWIRPFPSIQRDSLALCVHQEKQWCLEYRWWYVTSHGWTCQAHLLQPFVQCFWSWSLIERWPRATPEAILWIGWFYSRWHGTEICFSLKGDAGTKYCLLCHNLMAKRSMLSDCLLCDGAFNTNGLVLATDASIRDTLQRLEAKHASLGQADFKLWQQACGFSYCKHGLVFDDSLKALVKPMSMFIHDWMHCLVACGCFETCMHLCLVAILAVLPTFYETANAWLQSWHLAGSMSTFCIGKSV